MHTQARNFGLLVMAFCLAWSIGAAGTAFAADDQALTAGIIASEPEQATSSEAETETEPAHADGWEQSGSNWTFWKNGEQVRGRWVVTSKAPGIKGTSKGKHRYWIAKGGYLAVNRLIDPSTDRDADAGYYAYATKKGYVATTGKHFVDDKLYIVKNDKGALASGNPQGFLTTRKYDNGEKHIYYIDPATHAVTTGKPVKVKDFGWVYAYAKKGYLLTGMQKVDKTHIVLAEDNGKIRNYKGWFTSSKFGGVEKRYYVEPTKKYPNLCGARIGSFKVDGHIYLADSEGALFRNGYKLHNGNYYWVDSKGMFTYNGVITNMYKKAQRYSSPSQYLIMVDVNDTKFIVFEGWQGNWNVKYIWDCSTGAPSTPTPIGVWQVGIKGYSFGHGYTCYYYTQFNGDYLIHTRIYEEGTHILRDAAMNTQVSQGCVRLYDEDAYWVYQNIPAGTTVVTIP